MNPVQKLSTLGQSPWLDFIRRSFILDGSLSKLITEDDLRGVTSNPAIFEQAIAGSTDYDDTIQALAGEGKSALEIYDALSIKDVMTACDLFTEVFKRTEGLDGYVSLEVSPLLAHDTEGTLVDARRLWKELDRPNAMIKIPATQAGVPAIKQALIEGININVTLLFSLERYEAVALAYIEALEERHAKGLPLHIASVASFFVSRMDSLVDPKLEALGKPEATALLGEVAIANSRAAYGIFEKLFRSDRFAVLAKAGARPQRLLWASTSTKNPAYPKVKYVDALVGPDTVDTIPLQTVHDYRSEGDPADRLTGSVAEATAKLKSLESLGFSLTELAQTLEDDAIAKFVDPFHSLIQSIEDKRKKVASV